LLRLVFNRKRDFYAGGLMVVFGLYMALNGPTYMLGTLMHMGPGFMPTALGVILTVVGILIAAPALGPRVPSEDRILPEQPQWFAWACIIAGPILFIICGSYGGLVPATFACVFVAALGDRTATYTGALGLATFITILGVVLFHFVLNISMPVLEWRGL